MSSDTRPKKFLGYPEPLKGPDVPYHDWRKTNPALRGVAVVIAALAMEYFRFIRELVWRNAGFGSLRKLQRYIEDYEPQFEPTVIPLSEAAPEGSEATDLDAAPTSQPNGGTKFPAKQFYSVADYRALYLSGELTPTEVAETLVPLIRRDTTPPGEHSVAWFDTKVDLVLKAAEASTLRYKEKRSLGPLDGVPTAVKDEYDVVGYKTCLGSVNDYTGDILDSGSNASWCVRKLEEAGAVILGKTSMHEFGLDTTGNNPAYGTPPNPFNSRYYTGGSSSGSGYAVGAGLIPIALGSDGGGSVRIPASFCSVFGLKPTHGRLSFKPGQNHCSTCAVLGPLAADVRSLAAVYEVIAAPHPTSPFPPPSPLRLRVPSSDSRGKTLGIPEAWFARATPAVRSLCDSLIARLVSTHGYRTVPVSIPFLVEGQIAHALVVLNDASTLLPDTRGLTPANRVLLALGRATPANDFVRACKLRRLLTQHLAALWAEHPNLQIVTPTTSCAGFPVRGGAAELRHGVSDGDRTIATMEYCWLANFCGLPSLSVPAGYVVPDGAAGAGEIAGPEVEGKVPVGLMATGEWASEELLLRFALDAEEEGAERRARPPVWVDVVGKARERRGRNEDT